MKLKSTNRNNTIFPFQHALFSPLAPNGGLFMPVEIPRLSSSFFKAIAKKSLQDIARETSALWFPEIPKKDINRIVEKSLPFGAPLVFLNDALAVLELFHGPTLSFKDFGARFMAELMRYFLKKGDATITILTATSGDTGAAVAHSFFQNERVRAVILYPQGRVSDMQEKQMGTLGANITAIEVNGTFDDCQTLVKQACADADLAQTMRLGSANSINIARLIPQTFYYFYAYAQAQPRAQNANTQIVFSVPCGNFGSLTAGLIAKRMGLPIKCFIAATNSNDVVPRYLTGEPFTPKASQKTISNAMDIGNPSNFARMLDLYHHTRSAMQKDVFGGAFNDNQTRGAISELYNQYGYISDPHGAVAYLGLKKYCAQSKQKNTLGIFLETAHPVKFSTIVEPLIGTKIPLPAGLQKLLNTKKQTLSLSNKFEELKEFLMR